MSRFLPPGGPYDPTPKKGEFTSGSPDLLERIGSAMEVKRAHTQGRIPSPVSRAYMFYANLFLRSLGDADDRADGQDGFAASEGREDLQGDARHTLRGLLATFALRDVLDFDIGVRSIRLSEKAADNVSEVLVPALQATPGGEELWNPVQFYILRTNGREEVLAGRSPLTGIYPAATPPRHLTGLYWYAHDEETGTARWYDPTSTTLDEEGQFFIADSTRRRMQQLIKAWLNHVLSNVGQSDLERPGIGMEARDAQGLLRELDEWRDELYNVDVPNEIEVTSSPIGPASQVEPLPILNSTVQASADHIWSDLPIHEGRLIVTYEEVRSETTRLYGRYFGNRKFEGALDRLPREGTNLGRELGLGENAIPVPFLYIDELFTPNLTQLTMEDPEEDTRGGLSSEWEGLEIEVAGTTEYYLVPLRPKILEIMDPDTLFDSLSAELSGDQQNYVVRLRFGDTTITKLYSTTGDGRHQIDNAIGRDEFDLRLFPNYDIDAVRHLITGANESTPHEDVDHVDDVYYARLRLSPKWSFRRADPFAIENGEVKTSIQDNDVEIGDETQRSGQTRSTGKAVFYSISKTPDGFFVPKRGFCRLQLEDPRRAGENTENWSVGIDFGTSNTCVAKRNADDDTADPDILQLPVLTTTLLNRPNYNAKFGHVFEGASAALDFFYNFSGDDDQLMSQLYFPTQLLTQQQTVESDDAFDVRNGLIYFDNISLADPTLLSLIRGFPQVQKEVAQRFNLKQDIKWDQTDWLRVFMHHLRKQVVLTAAAENARVEELHFSYPKSFDFSRQNRFEGDLDMVWGDTTGSGLTLASESEAARDYVVEGFNQHVIFDIGGGTTDIIGFHEQEPIFQTSFRLAAGQVNDYVIDAPGFREKFVEAIEQRAKKTVLDEINSRLLDQFQATAASKRDRGVILQLWLGLLQRITDVDDSNESKLLTRILNYLRTEAEQQDPIQGFFLTNAMLMGGLSYYTGQLLRTASNGGFENEEFPLSQVTLTLTGNGSRLYNMLNHADYPFSEVMQQLFRAGAKVGEEDLRVEFDGLFTYENVPAPKVTVALGLLRSTHHGELRNVPVANVAAEEGYPAPENGETDFETSLVEYYQSVFKRETPFDPPREAPANLQGFLDAMGDEMPYGKHGQFQVIPAAHKQWAEELKTSVYDRAVPLIKDRGHKNARQAEDIEGVAEEDRPALEPLFVAELVGMMEAIRDEYAT